MQWARLNTTSIRWSGLGSSVVHHTHETWLIRGITFCGKCGAWATTAARLLTKECLKGARKARLRAEATDRRHGTEPQNSLAKRCAAWPSAHVTWGSEGARARISVRCCAPEITSDLCFCPLAHQRLDTSFNGWRLV